jgi:hypothetical protein
LPIADLAPERSTAISIWDLELLDKAQHPRLALGQVGLLGVARRHLCEQSIIGFR